MQKFQTALLVLAVAMAVGASRPVPLPPTAPQVTPPPFTGELSVMTYNIHGLPWPIAWGRPAQLARIAATLRDMRHAGRNPHIVVLQEAFTQDAQSIGRAAGYRYIAQGPSADMAGVAVPARTGIPLADGRSWLKGEDMGKYVGSGLQILSDYPITGVRRMAYPALACAGYDCLANKGALMASIQLPDRPDQIDIVTTHLNSRRASEVSDDRSFEAYRLQIACLSAFIRQAHNPAHALIVAGDFNVGKAADRRNILMGAAEKRWVANGDIVRDAYDAASRGGIRLSPDAAFSQHRAKDWEFYAGGKATDISLIKIDVPFGHAADGSMLSDHVGYAALFKLSRRLGSPTNPAQSKA